MVGIFIYLFFAMLVGFMGQDRVLGFWMSFLWAILLSPVGGLIVVLLSKSQLTKNAELNAIRNNRQQTELLKQMASQKNNKDDKADELAKWKAQLDAGTITPDEYQKIKNKIMAQFD